MKVQIIGLDFSKQIKNYLLTPELLAAVLARYSRSNKGIDNIISSIDFSNPEESVDRIFKFIDYGHTSIGGLTGGIPIVIDGCSMFLAYKIFEIAQFCDGQESSTRYIKMDNNSLPDPVEIGIPSFLEKEWYNLMTDLINFYNKTYSSLEEDLKNNSNIIKIPENVTEKVKERLYKNYALDRSRYFIPFSLKTNAAYIMSGRAWTETLRQLESLPYKEAKDCAQKIRTELEKIIPRLLKHSYPDTSSITQTYQLLDYSIKKTKENISNNVLLSQEKDKVYISINNSFPDFLSHIQSIKDSFKGKSNRYSLLGTTIKRTFIRVSWNNISIAELRDLNRHRTGFRFSTLVPVGFYLPIETGKKVIEKEKNELLTRTTFLIKKILSSDNPYNYIYTLPMGTQVPFEHNTQLDKFIYEIELRTDLGAHFRYSEHLKKAYEELIKKLPALKNFIKLNRIEEDN